jgi:hypothetical protein
MFAKYHRIGQTVFFSFSLDAAALRDNDRYTPPQLLNSRNYIIFPLYYYYNFCIFQLLFQLLLLLFFFVLEFILF